ncbi:PASTA domain-containing protein [Microbacterium sp. ZW T6_19]|uniref:PASTA domain-containing protein n=1 Tax=Microbacterium sp. ZW T6_19 TaxID=3378082 RepID=UPI003852C241
MDSALVVVPGIVGQYVHIARDQLLKLGLDLAGSEPDGEPITAATWPGIFVVTSQDPDEGTVAHRGDQIRISFVADGQAREDVASHPGGPKPVLSARVDEQPGDLGR